MVFLAGPPVNVRNRTLKAQNSPLDMGERRVCTDRRMGRDDRIRQLVEHCDLDARLKSVPASAQLRGLYFKNTIAVMKKENLLDEYSGLFPETYSAVRWYPVSDFLQRLAVAGALLEGPENVHHGMLQIGRHNAAAFAKSLLGQTVLKLLSRDPQKILKQACAGRRQSCRYGRWEVEFPEPNMAVMHMFEEYLWIESNVLGAAEGTLEGTGCTFDVRYEVDSAFQGRHILKWSTP
jgi:uncharacterized protein (TIGR02265 family)